jgi:hypothetical protein
VVEVRVPDEGLRDERGEEEREERERQRVVADPAPHAASAPTTSAYAIPAQTTTSVKTNSERI